MHAPLCVFTIYWYAFHKVYSSINNTCDVTQYYPLVMLQVRACKSGGIDTRVRGVSVIGRVDMNEDEIAASFSFLTVEDAVRDSGLVRQRRKKDHETADVHTNKVTNRKST